MPRRKVSAGIEPDADAVFAEKCILWIHNLRDDVGAADENLVNSIEFLAPPESDDTTEDDDSDAETEDAERSASQDETSRHR